MLTIDMSMCWLSKALRDFKGNENVIDIKFVTSGSMFADGVAPVVVDTANGGIWGLGHQMSMSIFPVEDVCLGHWQDQPRWWHKDKPCND